MSKFDIEECLQYFKSAGVKAHTDGRYVYVNVHGMDVQISRAEVSYRSRENRKHNRKHA